MAIDVDDKPGKQVALTVDKPEGVGVGPVCESDTLAQHPGALKTPFPKVVVDGLVFKRKDANGDAAVLVVACGDMFALRGQDADNLPLLYALFCMMDGAREHPGVSSEKALLLPAFKINLFQTLLNG